jgi:hypothetical protein
MPTSEYPERGIEGQSSSVFAGASRLSRRAVLRAGTIGAAAVGAVTAFPGVLGGLGAEAPEVSGAASEATAGTGEADAAAVLDGPIVAHIRDVTTGEVSLFVGEREIAYRDATLVQHLVRAAR